VLTFWADCFTVDDGPPRKYDDPQYIPFLNDIQKGVAPRELYESAPGSDLNIELLRKPEEYKPPTKPKIVAFSGAGLSLSNNTPPSQPPKASERVNAQTVVVDLTLPVTTIQVRLHDGSRLLVKCNLIHTVGDLRSHIESLHPSRKGFELRMNYPNKVLSDNSETIEGACLVNAAIVQRLL